MLIGKIANLHAPGRLVAVLSSITYHNRVKCGMLTFIFFNSAWALACSNSAAWRAHPALPISGRGPKALYANSSIFRFSALKKIKDADMKTSQSVSHLYMYNVCRCMA